MASLFNQVPSISTVFAIYTSLSAITMISVTSSFFNEIVPKPFLDYITVKVVDLFSSYFQSSFTFVIEQKWEFCDRAGLSTGELLVGSSELKYPAAELNLGVPINTKIVDEIEGILFEWTLHYVETKNYPYGTWLS